MVLIGQVTKRPRKGKVVLIQDQRSNRCDICRAANSLRGCPLITSFKNWHIWFFKLWHKMMLNIYFMGSLILVNDWQSLHSLIFDNWTKNFQTDAFKGETIFILLWHYINIKAFYTKINVFWILFMYLLPNCLILAYIWLVCVNFLVNLCYFDISMFLLLFICLFQTTSRH